MNNPDFKKWVKLTITSKGDTLLLSYEDGLGNEVIHENNYEMKKLDSFYGFIPVLIPIEIYEYFGAVLTAEPRNHQTAADFNKPIPLGVFIEEKIVFLTNFTNSELAVDYEKFIYELFGKVLSENSRYKFQIINFLPNKITPPFSLPMNIRFSGRHHEELIRSITKHNWYASNPSVQTNGLILKVFDFYDPDEIDILVIEDYMAMIFFMNAWQTYRSMPRFIIVLDSYSGSIFDYKLLLRLQIPCLHLKYYEFSSALNFFEEFLYSIIHDFPLHEALNYSKEKVPNVQSILYASPESNQSLRLSAAFESFNKMIKGAPRFFNPENTAAFLNKFQNYPPQIRTKIESVLKPDNTVNDFLNRTNNLNIYFNGESTGLVPLSIETDNYKLNQPHFEQINATLRSIVNDKEVFKALRENQDRRVDITMDEFGQALMYVPIYKNYPLIPGKEYRVNVTIGQITWDSLMVGNIPAIDPLLPDPDNEKGHELEVVIFPKDFTLLSGPIKKIYLPLLGGAEPVRFNVRTPKESKIAELRVDIFHKNHLLQGFLLKANIENERNYYPDQQVTVSLDLSNSSRFTNIDMLQDRELFIGINDNSDGTHSFFIKKDSVAEEIRGLTHIQMDDIQTNFKKLLTEAYFDSNKKPRFKPNAKPGDKRSEEFFEEIRKFAKYGSELYDVIAEQAHPPLYEKLEEVKKSIDKEIQIGRHNQNYSFPWSLIYDYDLPTEIEGGSKNPVCIGEKFKNGEYEQFRNKQGFGCPHNPGFDAFCLEGFWGIRHSIEQIFNDSELTDTAKALIIEDSSKIFFSYNVRDDYSEILYKKMKANPGVVIVDSNSSLMDLLWNKESRPSALIVLGHLNTLPVSNEPKEDRIITFPKVDWNDSTDIPAEKWICKSMLTKYKNKFKKWEEQPLPLVFLISCSSSEFNIRSLGSIISGFKSAGAAAIIGTESDITTGLGQRFIEEVMDNIFNKNMQLGKAIQSFNKNLFQSGIPLPFVFTCFGNINLKVIKN